MLGQARFARPPAGQLQQLRAPRLQRPRVARDITLLPQLHDANGSPAAASDAATSAPKRPNGDTDAKLFEDPRSPSEDAHGIYEDTYKERKRSGRRVTFGFPEWRKHRSSSRYLHHVLTLFESGIVRGIAVPVMFVTAFALGIATYNAAFTAAALPAWAPPLPAIAIEPIQLTSIALSLLLVFRTNASYARWDEGRRAFGSLTTVSRDIARQAFAWFEDGDNDSRARLCRWLVALARCTMAWLRDEHDLRYEMTSVLRPDEATAVLAAKHPPTYCLQVITRIVSRAGLPSELVIRLDENVGRLTDAVSSCERILNTPIPLSYTRHTARFLMVWLTCLPFCLWSYCGWAMVPIAALVAFVLLGIEEIGVYIEEPFSILPLEQFTNKLENILIATLANREQADNLAAGSAAAAPLAAAHAAN